MVFTIKKLYLVPVYLQQAGVVQVSVDTMEANLEMYAYLTEHVSSYLLIYSLEIPNPRDQLLIARLRTVSL